MKLLLILLCFFNLSFSQQDSLKNYRISSGPDIIHYDANSTKYYSTVYIIIVIDGILEKYQQWLKEDIIPREVNGAFDIKTQEGLYGVGDFISGNFDSTYINVLGAMKMCPEGWRIPRIGEWDTLFKVLTVDDRKLIFSKLPGYLGTSNIEIRDSIIKKESFLKGGFWWSSTFNESWVQGVELDTKWNVHFGKAPLSDKASVRCVRDVIE
jgi:uncharacterized protein (TIGR02145 family)